MILKMILKNPSFRSLWFGQTLYQLGLSFYIIGTVTLLYTETQSILWATLFPLIRFGVSWLSGMVAPLAMQRIPLRKFLILTHISLASLLLGVASYLTQCELFIPILLLFIVIISFLEGWGNPSRSAMPPRTVQKDNLVQANSLLITSNKIATCIGFISGGSMVEMLGTVNTLWASFFLISIAALCFMYIKDSSSDISDKRTEKCQVLKETWAFVYKHPLYSRLFALDALEYIAASAWAGSIMLAFVKDVLGKTDAWWGYIHGSYLFGSVVGGFIALSFSQWLKKRLKLAFIIGSANLGILTIFLAFSPVALLSITIAILIGIPYQMREIALQTMLQTNADDSQLPRIYSIHNAITSLSVVIGISLMGIIAKFCGPQMALLFSGVLVLISAVLARYLPQSKD